VFFVCLEVTVNKSRVCACLRRRDFEESRNQTMVDGSMVQVLLFPNHGITPVWPGGMALDSCEVGCTFKPP
jgi:hypothetical protein